MRPGPPATRWRRSSPATRTGSSTSCRSRKKLVVMLGGPTMNLLIAVVLLTAVATTYGIGEPTAADQLASRSASPCRPSARPRRRVQGRRPRRPGERPRAPARRPHRVLRRHRRSARGTRSARSIRPQRRPDAAARRRPRTASGWPCSVTPIVDRPCRWSTTTASPCWTRPARCAPSGSASSASPRPLALVRQPVTAVPGDRRRPRSARPPASSCASRRRWSASPRPRSARARATRTARCQRRRRRPGRRRGRRRPDRRPGGRRREQVRHPPRC